MQTSNLGTAVDVLLHQFCVQAERLLQPAHAGDHSLRTMPVTMRDNTTATTGGRRQQVENREDVGYDKEEPFRKGFIFVPYGVFKNMGDDKEKDTAERKTYPTAAQQQARLQRPNKILDRGGAAGRSTSHRLTTHHTRRVEGRSFPLQSPDLSQQAAAFAI